MLFSIDACASNTKDQENNSTAHSVAEKQAKLSSMLESFDYKPVKMGFGEEGYEQLKMPDGIWEVKIIAMKSYPQKVLELVLHKRASEICDSSKYSVVDIREMIDICSEGGCFKSAVWGTFKCL
jgi:hypothetical protein